MDETLKIIESNDIIFPIIEDKMMQVKKQKNSDQQIKLAEELISKRNIIKEEK
jgi:hypothetical protein